MVNSQELLVISPFPCFLIPLIEKSGMRETQLFKAEREATRAVLTAVVFLLLVCAP
jgi:hypothetical protein